MIFRITLLALFFAGCNVTFAQQTDTAQKSLTAIVDEVVEKQIEQQQLAGLCVGVIQNGEVVCLRTFGHQDREQDLPTSTNTMYRWASVSKPVTAIAAMQLVEQGKLSLDDDVRKYVPEFPDHGHLIRIRDLMCHQSGIVHYSNGKVLPSKRRYEIQNPYQDVINALDKFQASPLVHPPCEKYSYSTHAYILLSAVVQRAGEQKFIDQVNERICKPLGLETLQPDYQWKEIPNRAVGYRKPRRSGRVRETTNTDVSWKLAGGGFISSIEDMTKFATGLLGDELIQPETRQIMWTPQKLADGTQTNVGLGVFVGQTDDNSITISHNGSQEKTRTRLVIWPDSGFGVVVMSNSQHAEPGKITTAVYNAVKK